MKTTGGDRMAKWRWLLSAALASSAIASVATVQADDDKAGEGPISIDQIPAPAREAIQREAGGGTITMVHKETWSGQPVYEGHIRHGAREGIIWVDAEGHVLHKH
jgi:hypothetical protein